MYCKRTDYLANSDGSVSITLVYLATLILVFIIDCKIPLITFDTPVIEEVKNHTADGTLTTVTFEDVMHHDIRSKTA